MDSLSARMDTMSIDIKQPYGKVYVSPQYDKPDQPKIIISYNSEKIKTLLGKSSFTANTIKIKSDILNDNTQKDIFLQWIANGSLELNQGNIDMAGFSYPIDIPSVKMSFEPEIFNIEQSKVQIDRSDFQLTGNLNNVLSYFRGDSILRGDFSFVSNTTDVLQLMSITNGIGHEDSTKVEKSEYMDSDTSYTGPYMVPKGIDLFLTTNIKKVTMGIDTATNIIGSVQVHDGILILDGLSFKTPGPRECNSLPCIVLHVKTICIWDWIIICSILRSANY